MTLTHNHHALKSMRILFAILVLTTTPIVVFGWGTPQKGVQGSEADPTRQFPATNAEMPMSVNEVQLNNPPSSSEYRRLVPVSALQTSTEIDLSDITDLDGDPLRYFRRYYGNVSDGGMTEKILTINYNLEYGETAQILLRVVDIDQEHEDGKSAFIQVIDLVGVLP